MKEIVVYYVVPALLLVTIITGFIHPLHAFFTSSRIELTLPSVYGKFAKDNCISVNSRIGWWLLELPCSVVFLALYLPNLSMSLIRSSLSM
jgi:hypothetical protein